MNRRDRFHYLADRLDQLAEVPTETLASVVMSDGACVTAMSDEEPPELTGQDSADRELAAQLCSGCPVQDHCLELELRWSGPQTAGVFGALPPEDRRELYPHWRARRQGGGHR